jgi:hypothetical protein
VTSERPGTTPAHATTQLKAIVPSRLTDCSWCYKPTGTADHYCEPCFVAFVAAMHRRIEADLRLPPVGDVA